MIDINLIRNNRPLVEENLRKKYQENKVSTLDEIIDIDKKVRELKAEGDNLRQTRNKNSDLIGLLFKEKKQEEANKIKEEVKAINEKMKVPCTGCRYCMPCPRKVDIPGTFSAYNKYYTDSKFVALKEYLMCTALRKDATSASNCIECGRCEQHCPQGIEIRKELKNARKKLESPIYKIAKKIAQTFLKY